MEHSITQMVRSGRAAGRAQHGNRNNKPKYLVRNLFLPFLARARALLFFYCVMARAKGKGNKEAGHGR